MNAAAAPSPAFASFAEDYAVQTTIAPHRHADAQLTYTVAGVIVIETPDGPWSISPRQALWLPPLVEHAIVTRGLVRMRALYVAPARSASMPKRCCAINVSAFLRELIVRAVDAVSASDSSEHARALCLLTLEEVRACAIVAQRVVMPASPALLAICEELRREPGRWESIDDVARRFGMSGKTLNRLFHRELNTSFGKWCQQVRLDEAMSRLGRGDSVTSVAVELGYASPSAFTAMFRRALGSSPTRYLSRRQTATAALLTRSES